jgi:phytoene dehydrogenase-like protein
VQVVSADAVVIGAGPNGLVAANLLADAGWSVVVLEAQPVPGGAVRSAEVTAPGFVNDLYSSFYPLAAASDVVRGLELEQFGLRWRHAPEVLAHPFADGRAAVLSRDLSRTAASVEQFGAGDGAAWTSMTAAWQRLSTSLLGALFTPFPPVRAGTRLARELGAADALRFARFCLLSTSRHAAEEFAGEGAAMLLAGNALHTDLSPTSPGSAVFGWLLASLGQTVGFPVPEGGAQRLTDALVDRLVSRGGRVECDARVAQVVVRGGRAVAVRTADGREVGAGRAVVADVTAPQLYLDLVGREHLPARLLDDLRRFQWDDATVKVDWALDGPVPWQAQEASGAGTVHVVGGSAEATVYSQQLERGVVPERPYLLVGQMTTTDPTRSPAGTEALWAYTHVPARPRGDAAGVLRGDWSDADDQQRFLDRVEAQLERFAPGFGQRVRARHVSFPPDLQAANGNLVRGAVNGGSSALHQQLVFRPTPGLGRPETPVAGLYLASSSAHPGGGVHGAPGANAARAALHAGTTGRLALAVTRALAGGGGGRALPSGTAARPLP